MSWVLVQAIIFDGNVNLNINLVENEISDLTYLETFKNVSHLVQCQCSELKRNYSLRKSRLHRC